MNNKEKILNIKHNTYHTVDIVESFGEHVVVFTEDKKCFPVKEVMSFKKIIFDFIKTVLDKKQVSDELSSNFTKVLEGIGFIDKVKSTIILPFDEKDLIR